MCVYYLFIYLFIKIKTFPTTIPQPKSVPTKYLLFSVNADFFQNELPTMPEWWRYYGVYHKGQRWQNSQNDGPRRRRWRAPGPHIWIHSCAKDLEDQAPQGSPKAWNIPSCKKPLTTDADPNSGILEKPL